MKTIALNCNHCGAPLSVPEYARFVTCRFCDTQLAIENHENVYFTKELIELKHKAEVVSNDVEQLKVEADIDRLERQWELERTNILGNSVAPPPSVVVARLMLAMSGIVGFFVVCLAMVNGVHWSILSLVVVFGLLGVSLHRMGESYEVALSRYESRRRKLHRRLENLTRNAATHAAR